MPSPPISSNVRSLLVICPSWVGDTVMATPLLRALRSALPTARLIGAVRPGLDELLRGTGWLDEMIVEKTKTLPGLLRAVRRIRRARPEAALLLPNSVRAAIIARLGGPRIRVGHDRSGRGPLLTHALRPNGDALPVPAIDYYARLGRFALQVEPIDRHLELCVTEAERTTARRLLEGVVRPFLLLNPGANKPRKRWPAERFGAVADGLARTHGLSAVATGSPGERHVVQAVVESARTAGTPVCNLIERGITLGSLKAVIHESRLLVTNDTGPRHMAAALGTPVVALFGPTDQRWTTVGSPHERILVADPFLPQELTADDHPQRCAVDRIPVSDVLEAARQLLEERD